MTYRLSLLGTLILLLWWSSASAQMSRNIPSDAPQTIPGRLLVKLSRDAFQTGPTVERLGAAVERFDITDMRPWINRKLLLYGAPLYRTRNSDGTYPESPRTSLMRIMVVEYSASTDPTAVADAVQRIPGVEYAEPIYRRRILYSPNDPDRGRQWYLDSIAALKAWDVVKGSDGDIILAITDTGIEADHEDLADALWLNPGENGTDGDGKDKKSNGIDDDDNGYVDDWWGWDFGGSDGYSPDNDPSAAGDPHGTFVAGVAGAVADNDIGISGTSFGARLMAVKISDDRFNPDLPGRFDAVVYAAAMGADVINCSWGGPGHLRSEQEVINFAVREMGAVVVAAAGNNGTERKIYPAAYDGVISVAGVDLANKRVTDSNYDLSVDISSPGSGIYSTTTSNDYKYDAGTSFATPIVSAGAALVLTRFPGLTPEEVTAVLQATADDISATLGSSMKDKMGTGRINLFQAVSVGTDAVMARMIGYEVEEPSGDGLIDPGETVTLRVSVKNILAASTVSARLASASHPALTIEGAEVDFGELARGGTATSPEQFFRFTVPEDLESDAEVTFVVAVSAGGRTINEYFTLTVRPSFATTRLNKITSTFNSIGNIGYNGLNRDQGEGFLYNNRGSYLYHGGLMIGFDAAHLADVVRKGSLSEGIDDGFRSTKLYRTTQWEELNMETGIARFNDSHLPENGRVGVDVELRTYEYLDPDYSNIMIVVYNIRNTGSTELTSLHCGYYLDWDVGELGDGDQADFDKDYRMGFVRNSLRGDLPYIGVSVLSPQPVNYYAVENIVDGIRSWFPDEKKWSMLSQGISNQRSVGDVAMVIGAGPFSIQPNDTVNVAFAFFGAPDFQELRATATDAANLYAPSSVEPGEKVRKSKRLTVTAAPNPAGDYVDLRFGLLRAGEVTISLHNLSGEAVIPAIERTVEAGEQMVRLSLPDLPGGPYFYRVITAEGEGIGAVVIVKRK